MISTPECDRMLAVKDKSQVIGNFLEWLDSVGLVIDRIATKKDERDDDGEDNGIEEGQRLPYYESIEKLLARYFKIDLNKVDAEQRAILDEIRESQKAKEPI